MIFEGIMGSGKTTATSTFGGRLAALGLRVAAFAEGAAPHPVRASDDLADFYQPWTQVTAFDLSSRVHEKWARYVERRLRDEIFTVMDGQLFHGDLTNLFMMDMAPSDISAHTSTLMRILAPLRPLVIYFRQDDLEHALHHILGVRGPDWEAYQLGWKLRSPYAACRQLVGVAGLNAMYFDYRALTDSLFDRLDCAKLAIETGGGDWRAYYEQISEAMENANLRV